MGSVQPDGSAPLAVQFCQSGVHRGGAPANGRRGEAATAQRVMSLDTWPES
jgi:hypothetical protein